ncbi:hypothetical protein CHS0354_013587 [Potamilus streckersoni]|uniref:Exonuclease domain-containing protein n=1 Tax=Potamilus streckersoni TaxID=2493646 RepID=A0AAE0SKJ3_9BIVA|nr:hypothetical protein CHS0354_013587 [Potamilus streckersoni]
MEGEFREMNKNKFATLVFMDMETTGLIEHGKNPMIMELCLVSVQREDLLNENSTARVLNKLLLCFNPGKPISAKASELTGLYNDCLESQHVFCLETAQLINGFLQHLPQPVCLLAHNGNHFDFPILLAELNKINQSLASTVFCADSLEAFRSLDGLVSSPWNHCSWQQNNKTPEMTTLRNSPPKVKKKKNLTHSDKDTDLKHINSHKTAKKKLKFDQEQVIAQPHNPKTNLKPNTSNEEHGESKPTKTEVMANWDLIISTDAQESKASTKLNSNNFTQCAQILDEQNEITESSYQQSLSSVQSSADEDLYQFALEIEQKLESDKVPKECPHENKDYSQGQEDSIMSSKELNTSECTTEVMNDNAAHALTSCYNQTPGTSASCYVTVGTGYTIVTNSSDDLVTKSNNQTIQAFSQNHSNSRQRVKSANDTNGCKVNSTLTNHDENRKPFVSYKLEKIYERTFQKLPPITHSAESDCITLLKVAQKRGPDILSWVDNHAVLFSAIKTVF